MPTIGKWQDLIAESLLLGSSLALGKLFFSFSHSFGLVMVNFDTNYQICCWLLNEIKIGLQRFNVERYSSKNVENIKREKI